DVDQNIQNDSAENAYDELIGQIYSDIETDNLEESILEGSYSLYISLNHLEPAERLETAGYSIEDINGDGTPELLIGMVGENILFDLYALSDGKPVLVFESFARSSYSLMEDGKFWYYGSSSAASAGFGIFSLPAGSVELECEDFWFSDIKPGTDYEIGYYHNTTGIWAPEESEELTVLEDEFWEMDKELKGDLKSIELTPFAGQK
ncbi:MAG: hypothetical protein IKV72_00460, partial [Firmicutes bacterium]|nr:hypothetical protein [Bacillota bacterium]